LQFREEAHAKDILDTRTSPPVASPFFQIHRSPGGVACPILMGSFQHLGVLLVQSNEMSTPLTSPARLHLHDIQTAAIV
jgi:hypothetical protein